MKSLFWIMCVPDDGERSAEQIRLMLKTAEQQGHPLEPGSYLEEMTVKQLEALIQGRTDA